VATEYQQEIENHWRLLRQIARGDVGFPEPDLARLVALAALVIADQLEDLTNAIPREPFEIQK
jgi:hypothetical protein